MVENMLCVSEGVQPRVRDLQGGYPPLPLLPPTLSSDQVVVNQTNYCGYSQRLLWGLY